MIGMYALCFIVFTVSASIIWRVRAILAFLYTFGS